MKNETLIFDNNEQDVPSVEISTHDYSDRAQGCSRTWINDNETSSMDEIHIKGKAHIAIDANLGE